MMTDTSRCADRLRRDSVVSSGWLSGYGPSASNRLDTSTPNARSWVHDSSHPPYGSFTTGVCAAVFGVTELRPSTGCTVANPHWAVIVRIDESRLPGPASPDRAFGKVPSNVDPTSLNLSLI